MLLWTCLSSVSAIPAVSGVSAVSSVSADGRGRLLLLLLPSQRARTAASSQHEPQSAAHGYSPAGNHDDYSVMEQPGAAR